MTGDRLSNTDKRNREDYTSFLSQREKSSEWKGKNMMPWKKKHKIVENTRGRLPDLLKAFKSPGPCYILVSTAKILQSKSYSVCDYSLKNNLWLERQSIEQH